MIRLSLQPSPASDASAFKNRRALSSRCAGLFPFRISASSRSRSSLLNRTTYFFTEISFAAMIASVARVATKANHQILSIWLKRPTRDQSRFATDLFSQHHRDLLSRSRRFRRQLHGTYTVSVSGSATTDDFRNSLTDTTRPFGSVVVNGSSTGRL